MTISKDYVGYLPFKMEICFDRLCIHLIVYFRLSLDLKHSVFEVWENVRSEDRGYEIILMNSKPK